MPINLLGVGYTLFTYYQFLHPLRFPIPNYPQVTPLEEHFPVSSVSQPVLPGLRVELSLGWCALERPMPLSGQPEVLVNWLTCLEDAYRVWIQRTF